MTEYNLRDFLDEHPEVVVPSEILDKYAPRLPEYTSTPLYARAEAVKPVSCANPILTKDGPDWKATAEAIQLKFQDFGINAAEHLNHLGVMLNTHNAYRSYLNDIEQKYQSALKEAILLLEFPEYRKEKDVKLRVEPPSLPIPRRSLVDKLYALWKP